MSRSGESVLHLLLVFCLGLALAGAAQAYTIPPELQPLWPAEEKVLQRVAAGRSADLSTGPEGGKQEIRADFLAALLTGGFGDLKIHRHGIYLKNAVITGSPSLDLRSAVVPWEVRLVNCVFRSDVNCLDSHFKGSLQITKSVFEGEAHFLRMRVDRNTYFNKTIFKKPVNCEYIRVGEEFSLMGAQVEHGADSHFRFMQIGQNLLATNAVFKGRARFNNLKVGGTLALNESIFHQGAYFGGSEIRRSFWAPKIQFFHEQDYASFPGIKVGYIFSFPEAMFKGPVDFDGAQIDMELRGDKACFANPELALTAIGLKVATIARFEEAVFKGPVNFSWSQVGGQFNATNARFESPGKADFGSLFVGSLAQFTNAVFQGPVSFAGARIGGELKADVAQGAVLTGSIFRGTVDLRDAHLSDLSIIGRAGWGRTDGSTRAISERPMISVLNVERAVVDRDFLVDNVNVDRFRAWSFQGKGQTTLSGVGIESDADLRDCRFQNLKLIQVNWPPNRNQVQLSGLTYSYVTAMEGPGDRQDWRQLIAWVQHSRFDNRNYLQLRDFFVQQGYEDLADEVFINMKRQELRPRNWWDWLNPGLWARIVFWDILAGYGRKPLRIFWAAIAIVILGAFYYDPKYLTEINWPKRSRFYEILGRVLVSFEQFTPMVDLGMQKKWQPPTISGRFSVFIYVQRLSGWILIPIFLAAIYTKFK